MNLPFTADQFLNVFTNYNQAVWPLQVLLNVAALGSIILILRRFPFTDKAVTFTLAFLWVWMGAVYHITYFSSINPAAYGFGTLFVVQGLLFLWAGSRNRISYRFSTGWRETIGGILMLYGLVIYPVLGAMFGHSYPNGPTFGAPCPTTIFTFGVLLWSERVPKWLTVIPGLWSLIGFTAAITLGIQEDIGLLVAGLLGTFIVWMAKPKELTTPVA